MSCLCQQLLGQKQTLRILKAVDATLNRIKTEATTQGYEVNNWLRKEQIHEVLPFKR